MPSTTQPARGNRGTLPANAAVMVSRIPPASICAPELIALSAGSGSLRVRAEATDQLMAATIKAHAPSVSMGVSPKVHGMTHQHRHSGNPDQQRHGEAPVSRCVFMIKISESRHEHGNRGHHHRGDSRGHPALRPEQQPVIEDKNQNRQQSSCSPFAGPSATKCLSRASMRIELHRR